MTNRKYLLGSIVWGLAGVLPLVVGCASVEPVEQSEEAALEEEFAQALGAAVPGCNQSSSPTDGYVTSGTVKTLTLTPAGAGSTVILSAEGGYIRANGRICYDGGGTSGTALTTSNVTRIVVAPVDASGADRVLVDQAGGGFGSTILGTTGGITLTLGAGSNVVAFRGTSSADTYKMVESTTTPLEWYVDLSGDGANADAKVTTVGGTATFNYLLGAGNDSFSASNTGVTKFQNTTVSGGVNAPTTGVTVQGGNGNDSITGGGAADNVNGGAGNDTFFLAEADGTDGADTLVGGADSDTLDYSAASIDLGITLAGTVNVASNVDDLSSTTWEIVLAGTGNDTIAAAATAATISGGNGNDTITGSSASDSISGGNGNDSMAGGTGDIDDTLSGGNGDDYFVTLATDDGNDVFSGGNGTDELDYSLRTASLTVDLDGTADDGLSGETDNAGTDIEILMGGSGADSLTGGSNDETIYGGDGADSLVGGNGDDALFPGAETDTRAGQRANVDGDGSADTVDGGAGNDTIDFSGRGAVGRTLGVDVDLCFGTSTTCSASATSGDDADADGTPSLTETDLYINLEVVEGSSLPDVMTVAVGAGSTAGNVSLYGNDGADTITGGDGDDYIDGGTTAATTDVLLGGNGEDICDLTGGDTTATDCELEL